MNERLLRTADALRHHEFDVRCFETKEEALAAFLAETDPADDVGFGGSVTLEEMGLYDALTARGTCCYSHLFGHKPADVDRTVITDAAAASPLYVASCNAVTETGELLNIDGTGNRIASMAYGHKRCYLFVGKNKITGNLMEAYIRMQNVACVSIAQKFGYDTPCAVTGKCQQCEAKKRICRAILLLQWAPHSQPVTVYLINEKLGY